MAGQMNVWHLHKVVAKERIIIYNLRKRRAALLHGEYLQYNKYRENFTYTNVNGGPKCTLRMENGQLCLVLPQWNHLAKMQFFEHVNQIFFCACKIVESIVHRRLAGVHFGPRRDYGSIACSLVCVTFLIFPGTQKAPHLTAPSACLPACPLT